MKAIATLNLVRDDATCSRQWPADDFFVNTASNALAGVDEALVS